MAWMLRIPRLFFPFSNYGSWTDIRGDIITRIRRQLIGPATCGAGEGRGPQEQSGGKARVSRGQHVGGVFVMGGAGRGQRVDACLCTVELVYCLHESMSHLSSGTNPNKTFRAVVSYFFLERSSGCFSLLWL